MFRITQDPSSGITDFYLIKTKRSGSTVLVMCAVGLWRHIQDLWYVRALQLNMLPNTDSAHNKHC
jgi:hypothetical protein